MSPSLPVMQPMWPSPSNWVPTWPISVATNSSWKTSLFFPNGPPVGVPGMRRANTREPKRGMPDSYTRPSS